MKIHTILKEGKILNYLHVNRQHTIGHARRLGGSMRSMSIPKYTDLMHAGNRAQIVARMTAICCTISSPYPRNVIDKNYLWAQIHGKKPTTYRST